MNFERRPVLETEELQTDFSAKHCSAVEMEIKNYHIIKILLLLYFSKGLND